MANAFSLFTDAFSNMGSGTRTHTGFLPTAFKTVAPANYAMPTLCSATGALRPAIQLSKSSQCGRQESNLHSEEPDSKSGASANSATSASYESKGSSRTKGLSIWEFHPLLRQPRSIAHP